MNFPATDPQRLDEAGKWRKDAPPAQRSRVRACTGLGERQEGQHGLASDADNSMHSGRGAGMRHPRSGAESGHVPDSASGRKVRMAFLPP